MNVAAVLFLIAVIIFILAAFGVTFGGVLLLPLGLALFAAAFLVGAVPMLNRGA